MGYPGRDPGRATLLDAAYWVIDPGNDDSTFVRAESLASAGRPGTR